MTDRGLFVCVVALTFLVFALGVYIVVRANQ